MTGLACPREGGGSGGRGMTGRGMTARGPLQGCVMECHVLSCSACFPVLFCRYRFSLPLPSRSGRRGEPGCHGMSCFVMAAAGNVMFRHGPPGLRFRCRLSVSRMPFLHRVPSHSVPFAPPPARPAGGTLFRAYRARACPRVCAGAVRAPDCARETADARLPSTHAGVFEAPAALLRRNAKGGPGSRLPCRYCITLAPMSTTLGGLIMKNFQCFGN